MIYLMLFMSNDPKSVEKGKYPSSNVYIPST
jgi:hypothetical protein